MMGRSTNPGYTVEWMHAYVCMCACARACACTCLPLIESGIYSCINPLVGAMVLCFILAQRLGSDVGDGLDGWGTGDDAYRFCVLRAFSVQATPTAQMATPAVLMVLSLLGPLSLASHGPLLSSRSSPACRPVVPCWTWWTAVPCSTVFRWKVAASLPSPYTARESVIAGPEGEAVG